MLSSCFIDFSVIQMTNITQPLISVFIPESATSGRKNDARYWFHGGIKKS